MSVTKAVKQFGAKIEKNEVSGYYTYVGKNFTCKFNEEQCVLKWWEVNIHDDCPKEVVDHFEHFNDFNLKREVVQSLLELDREMDRQTSK